MSLFIGTPPFDLELVTEKQIKTLLDVSKISIPVITHKYRAVDDPGTSLKKIMERAKKEKENAAKVPELKKQHVQKEAEDGSVVVEERISEFYYFVLEKRYNGMYFLEKCAIVFDISENPYNGLIDDEVVKSYHEEYSGQWDKGADDCDFPGKFVYETVKTYLWQFKFSLAAVSKNIVKSSIIVMQLTWTC